MLEIAERVTVLRDGAKVGTFAAATIDGRKLSHLMTGKAFEYRDDRRATLRRVQVVLEVQGLGRDGDYDDVSLQCAQEKSWASPVLLGSGRTELALSLFGMNPPDRGTIRA